MLSRTTKRMLAAGLLLVARSQIGSAQEFQGIFHRHSAGGPGCAAPQPYSTYPSAMPVMPAMPIPAMPDGKAPEAKAPEAKADAPAPAQPNMNPQDFQPITASALGDTQFAMAAPQIMGDFAGYTFRRTVFVPVSVTTTTTIINNGVAPPTTQITSVVMPNAAVVPVAINVPVAGRAGSGFKVADDAGPIPTDRVFFSYNGFDGLRGASGFTGPVTTPVSNTTVGAITTVVATTTGPAAVNVGSTDLHREIFGFEKTFWGGDASIEVRLPIFQSGGGTIGGGFGGGFGGGGFAGDDFGDVTTILKFALVNERDRVFSIGLATTFPTGPTIETDQGNVNAVLFQPFVGFYRGYGNFFVQGFTSLIVSTASQDPTLLFNDYAVGYRLYTASERDFVRSITPALEVHVTTPLDTDNSGPLVVPDIVSFTGGVHVGLGLHSTLSVGCNIPVTGPRPYNAEALVQLNYRF